MAPLLEGILLGLTLAIMLGPAFFTLLQTAIHRGFRSGLILSAGIFLSDVSLVLLAHYGASKIIGDESNYLYFGIIGGIILIAFGIYTYTREVLPAAEEGEVDVNLPSPFTYLFKGYFLNITNPFLWLFWLSVVVSVSSNYGVNNTQVWVFFSGLLGTVLFTDILKSYAAGLIKGFLTPRVLTIVNRVVGVFLMLFGLLLMIRVGYSW